MFINRTILPFCMLFPITDMTAQDTLEYHQPAVMVTAQRSPISSLFVNRSFDIADMTMISELPATNIGDVIKQYANINVLSRGAFGVQSDLSIRGSLFSQNLILIDGMRLDDPQTAHHNFDLPITAHQVERIEILRGPSSAQYGANAFGGVINIITTKPEKTSANVQIHSGEYGLFNVGANLCGVWSEIKTSNSISLIKSDGYRYDTDFSTFNFSSKNEFPFLFGPMTFLVGYTKKEFGAFDFYSPGKNKPSREWTETSYLSLSSSFNISSIQMYPKISYRRHYDKFMDDLRTPSINVNIHTTDVIHGELVGSVELTSASTITSGIEITKDKIISNVYGSHQRTSGAIFTLLNSHLRKWIFDFGLRSDFNDTHGTVVSPTMGVGYILSSQYKWHFSAGHSFRAPTYTELFINTPNIIGDPYLKPERGWSFETGIEYYPSQYVRTSFTLFNHYQNNLIDYVKRSSTDIFHAVNFTEAIVRGAEFSFKWNNETIGDNFQVRQFLFAYGYLDSRIDKKNIYLARYSFTHPRHQLSATLIGDFPYQIKFSTGIVHKIKLDGKSYSLIDTKISKTIWKSKLILSGTNLLNQSYEEIVGVPLPGRWIIAGIEFILI